MNVSPDVNYEELARSTDDFNAAQLKAVSRRALTSSGPSHCNTHAHVRTHARPALPPTPISAHPLRQVCVEAGMLALRRDATHITHEDFNEAVTEVQAKKKAALNYYA